jgi:hypothetical protein
MPRDDYASIGPVYRDYRVADPRLAAFVHAALGDAHTVLNIIGALVPVVSVPDIDAFQFLSSRGPQFLSC